MKIPALLAARKDTYTISADDLAFILVTKADPILLSLNAAIPSMDDGAEADLYPRDFRQDFLYAMVKWGLVDSEVPSQILGTELEQIAPLVDAREIVRETGDVMDEQEGVERVVGMLAQFDGNQGVVVAAILEVQSPAPSSSFAFSTPFCVLLGLRVCSSFRCGLRRAICMHCHSFALV